ncbi:PAS domain S-box protein [Nostocaceae cyanobacterium CENA357]|uniref:histidine kinase n=1 Tax=Atlanticothrix silvestris CENA357 TaxID=1725252 RepID=A0A8J7L6U7_9CYAN|nr:PAS domain S-box protein [Atlanticothrix silvestris]MBH8556067.1 PAS domain S-box protein [Atlanticothrix silvestris CENA357]
MNRLSEKLVAGGFNLALLLLCGVGAVSYLSIQKLREEKQSVIHTHQVLEVLDKMRIGISNAQNARTSYILTQKAADRETYQVENQKVYKTLKSLRQLTRDNTDQQKRLDTLEPLIAQKFALLEQSMNFLEQRNLDQASQMAISKQVIEVREKLQSVAITMENEEKTLLKQRTDMTDARLYQIITVVGLGYGLSIVLLIVVYLLLQKQIHINKALSQEAICLEQQAAKAKLADILETVTDAFVALDRNWCYTYINQRAGKIFNRQPEDLIGKNIWEEFPEGVGQKFYHAYYQAMTEQRVIEMEEYYPPWERWFENRIYPSPEGLSIFFQDITRRKLAEIALERNERRYRSLVIATSQAIWITDPNGNIVEDIPSWRNLTGQSEAEVKGRGRLNAIHPEDRELTELLWTQALTTKSVYKTEHRVRLADGNYRFFASRAVPVLDDNDEIQEWVGANTDITERKLAEAALQQANEELETKVQERTADLQKLNEELKRSNQELEQFAYVASHDLQEPLRAVTGYSQLLGQEYQDRLDESAQEYLSYIVDGATRMQRLIQDLLAFSRVATRGQEFTSVDCNASLNTALSNLHIAIAESQAIITHDPLPQLLADKTQMVQLFQNLIGNAIKFRRKDLPPQIHIGAVKKADETAGELSIPNSPEWLFSVQDNGIGIKPQYLERIFEIFRRLHTRREFTGTGIGLAICKKIVERHGGRIWAESQLGVGTIFYLTLTAK